MTMRHFADHVIAVANSNGHRISNLQLQKIMYFAIGDYILENGITPELQNMYTEPFEAWTYGPVVRSQYFRFSGYGRYLIREKGEFQEEYRGFDNYIEIYINLNVRDLVDESHRHSTWQNNKQRIANQEIVEYELEHIRDDFQTT